MKDDSGPAFPTQYFPGVTIRDYFAAKAMQGMLSCEEPYYAENNVKADTPSRYAELAYEFADAMLEARKK